MKIFILAIVVAFVCMTVRHYKPEYSLICQLAGVIVLAVYALSSFENILSSFKDLMYSSSLDSSFLEVLLKALGISIVTDIASSICRDSGNNTLANVTDLVGKTIIIGMTLPILKKLADVAIGFIK